VVVDVSFISVRLLLPRLAELAPGADWLLLVKPQFEVGREQVGKGGVVRDDALRARAAEAVRAAAEALGWRFAGQVESRVPAPRGTARSSYGWSDPRPPPARRVDARGVGLTLPRSQRFPDRRRTHPWPSSS
jgi:predicted rRNA methylase YqxC with S4 and FtsJ domains